MRELEKKKSVQMGDREITTVKRSMQFWMHRKMGAPEMM